MKHTLSLLGLCLTVLALNLGLSGKTHAASADQVEAEAVVTRYFDALFNGDTLTLQSLLGGTLLTKRQPLLNNPDYPAHLARRYQGARFAIAGSATSPDGQIRVDTTLTLHDNHTLAIRFVLQRERYHSDASPRLYIVEEIAPDAVR